MRLDRSVMTSESWSSDRPCLREPSRVPASLPEAPVPLGHIPGGFAGAHGPPAGGAGFAGVPFGGARLGLAPPPRPAGTGAALGPWGAARGVPAAGGDAAEAREVDPWLMRWTQAGISPYFRAGGSLESTAQEVPQRGWFLPPIRAVRHAGHLAALDNRRLAVAKALRLSGWIQTVPVVIVPKGREWRRKADSRSDGHWIRIRYHGMLVDWKGRGFPMAGLLGGCRLCRWPVFRAGKADRRTRRASSPAKRSGHHQTTLPARRRGWDAGCRRPHH